VTVQETILLPAQPAIGRTEYVPLGGNGWDSPFSYYAVAVELQADGSGGVNDITVVMDPQFMSLIGYIQSLVISVASATDSVRHITITEQDHIRDTRQMIIDVESSIAAIYWTPPGITLNSTPLHTPTIRSVVENNDADDHFMNLRLYNFKKDAEKKVPLRLIMANLVRSGP